MDEKELRESESYKDAHGDQIFLPAIIILSQELKGNRCMVIETMGSPLQHSKIHQKCEPVVFFYCNRNEPQRRDPTAIIQTIVKQLSVVLPGLPKPVVEEYDKRVNHSPAPLGFQECHGLLVSLLDIFPQTTIIIDALDESDPVERSQLLEVLTTIMHSSNSVVKIFISSRDDIDIKLKLEKVPNLYIEAQDSKEDIENFIYREVTQSKGRGFSQLPDGLKRKVMHTLLEKANGM